MYMRPALRQAKIYDLVSQRGSVSVEVLAGEFDASAETIRRDLSVLADAGQLRKVHGGARAMAPAPQQGEGVFEARMRRNALAKRVIAEKLAGVIAPRQTIFMDTGSTTLICAQAIARIKKLTVITNSTGIAATMAEGSGGADVYLLGGRYRRDNAQTVGGTTLAEIASYRADIALLTIGALDAGGAMDFSKYEAEVARAMANAAAQVTLVADHSKFNRSAPFQVCDLGAINRLVSDKPPEAALANALASAEIELL